ncbi:MAG: hypothetical protein ABIS07_12885 [Dokdonella sp.]
MANRLDHRKAAMPSINERSGIGRHPNPVIAGINAGDRIDVGSSPAGRRP